MFSMRNLAAGIVTALVLWMAAAYLVQKLA